MDIYKRLFDYANLKFYRVEDKNYRVASGILLNYSSSSIVLLIEGGILHIPTNEIVEMYPFKPKEISFQDEEYKKILHDLGIKPIIVETEENENAKEDNYNGKENL
jgi:hypothetical protein